jgi:maltodextrin utilization protein YvdJ
MENIDAINKQNTEEHKPSVFLLVLISLIILLGLLVLFEQHFLRLIYKTSNSVIDNFNNKK